jgi:hypothetical protein
MEETRKEILRPQWDSGKQMWKIVKKTYNGSGGWANFSNITHNGRDETARVIDYICEKCPELYEKEVK